MDNKMIARYVRAFQVTRKDWIDALVKNPGHPSAPRYIMSINSKIELLTSMWNWSDESVEFPHE